MRYRILSLSIIFAFATFISSLAQKEMRMAQSSVLDPATITAEEMKASMTRLQSELLAKYGEGQKARISTGLHQVVEFWRPEDGDIPVFEGFVRANFAGDQASLDTVFDRFEGLLEQLDGHMHEITR